MRRGLLIVMSIAVIVIAYSIWSVSGRDYEPAALESHIKYAQSVGYDGGGGNLVAIQPYMVVDDYSSQERFAAKLDAYFQAAQRKGWFNSKTVVGLPEYLGSWLVAQGEKSQVYEAQTINDAMLWIAGSNLFPFTHYALTTSAPNRVEYALFRMKSHAMSQTYDQVLSPLAGKYGVTIVGGSIVLASPTISDGHLVSGDGPLFSVTPIYRPDGRAYPELVFKAHPLDVEQVFMQAKPVEELPVIESPVGKMGILICADSWYPEVYEVMKQKQAQVIVTVSYINTMEATWTGYSGYPNPADVEASDLNSMNLQEAWAKYAFAGRLPPSGISDGMLDCLRGRLWDLGFAGGTVLVKAGEVIELPQVDGASLVNMWL